MPRGFGERIVRGRFFERLTKKALDYLKDPDKLRALVGQARRKATDAGQTLLVIVAGILYFVLPIDVIPDFIVGAGLLDDVAVLTWVLNSVKPVLDDFGEWETARAAQQSIP